MRAGNPQPTVRNEALRSLPVGAREGIFYVAHGMPWSFCRLLTGGGAR